MVRKSGVIAALVCYVVASLIKRAEYKHTESYRGMMEYLKYFHKPSVKKLTFLPNRAILETVALCNVHV